MTRSARRRRLRLAVPGACLAAVVGAGCGVGLLPGSGPAAASPGPVAPAPAPPTSRTTPVPAEPVPSVSVALPSVRPRPRPSSSPRRGLATEKAAVSGREGRLSWRIGTYRFTGGGGAAEVDRRVRASLQDCVTRARREARTDHGDRRRLTGDSRLTTNDGRTVQVALICTDDLEGTAHPAYHLGTTAVEATDGDPILLSEVFRDERAAFRRLAPRIRAVAEAAGEEVGEDDGLAPREANWANWQTSDQGMTFYFGDYQLGGHGVRVYTLPWSVVRPLLTSAATRLLAPPS